MFRYHSRQLLKVTVPLTVDLSPQQVEEIFRMRLDELTRGCRMDTNGRLLQVVGTHPHNGEDVEEPFNGSLVDTTLIYGALALRQALKDHDGQFKKDDRK